MSRKPDILSIDSAIEFKKWYWLKAELITYAKQAGMPANGSKFEIRDRIIFALENPGEPLPKPKASKKTSKFNWAREELALDTIITDSISFGPNFRNFMKSQIGKHFNCHGDFMDWVKANSGKTLKDAMIAWEEMDDKKRKGILRKIQPHNMLSQYFRDFFDRYPYRRIQEARQCWLAKSNQENPDGKVVFEESDLRFLEG